MQPRLALAMLAILATAVIAATAAVGALAPHRKGGGRFILSGHVSDLYPGARRPLVIVVRNLGRRPLRVHSIKTEVRNATAACRASNVHVSEFRGTIRVAGFKSRRVIVRISMRRDTSSACRRATFPLTFRGWATR
jgi:hypothetical protein